MDAYITCAGKTPHELIFLVSSDPLTFTTSIIVAHEHASGARHRSSLRTPIQTSSEHQSEVGQPKRVSPVILVPGGLQYFIYANRLMKIVFWGQLSSYCRFLRLESRGMLGLNWTRPVEPPQRHAPFIISKISYGYRSKTRIEVKCGILATFDDDMSRTAHGSCWIEGLRKLARHRSLS